MEGYGFWSLVPPVVAILLAILTKQVFISLLFGIFLGYVIIADGNPLLGFFQSVDGIVEVLQDAGNARTVIFCALVGALIVFMQRSGGVAGFIQLVSRRLERYEDKNSHRGRRMVQLFAWATGVLIFVESSISVLTVGTLYRPLFDKLGISRERLAYVADSSSAPSSILIPFNGWGAFIMGLLAAQGFSDPFATMIRSVGYNFYPILALILVLIVIFTDWNIGPMKKAEQRVRETGKVLWDNAQPVVDEELTEIETKEGITPRAYNMVLPIVVMVLLMPIMLAYTGWAAALEQDPGSSGLNRILLAIGQGSGSTAVLIAVIGSILISMVVYKAQRILGIREMVDLTIKGIAGLMPLAILILLAFALGALCRQLETGPYVASIAREWLAPGLVPMLTFFIGCFIAFSTGTSWGTFAIMIPISVPMAQELGGDVYLTIAAALGGGVFGDHCSPISDTTILSSMASATDHIDHVKTQLPYALLAGSGAALLYLVMGYLV